MKTLFYHALSQRSVYDLSHQRLAHLLGHSMAYSSVDIRNFESLYTIVGNVCHKIHIIYVEFPVGLALGIDLTEKLYLDRKSVV